MNDQQPTATVTNDPIHRHFGLSYSNYLVLPRTLLQSMPTEWQERAVALLEELTTAFSHIEQPDCYEVTPAREVEYADLTDEERARLGVDRVADEVAGEGVYVYYDRDGEQYQDWQTALVPLGEDPVPDYNRGRTFIEPRTP